MCIIQTSFGIGMLVGIGLSCLGCLVCKCCKCCHGHCCHCHKKAKESSADETVEELK